MSVAWSYSKLTGYETCPLRHYELSVRKPAIFMEEKTVALIEGDEVHKAIAGALQGKPLPEPMAMYQSWVDKVGAGPGSLFVEEQSNVRLSTVFLPVDASQLVWT